MLTTLVENYPGFVDGVTGPELMETCAKQAERFGTEMIAEDVDRRGLRPAALLRERRTTRPTRAHTVIIATGASAKLLGLPSETKLMGRGVSTCATCDGFFFKDQNIMVVGGGDTAHGGGALPVAARPQGRGGASPRHLRASKIMQERAFKNPKISFIWDSVVEDVLDATQGKVTAVRCKNLKTGARSERPVDGLFVAIGHQPNTELFRGQLELHPERLHQGRAGHHADLRARRLRRGRRAGLHYRQAVTAAGTGCMAALDAERYLEAHHPEH